MPKRISKLMDTSIMVWVALGITVMAVNTMFNEYSSYQDSYLMSHVVEDPITVEAVGVGGVFTIKLGTRKTLAFVREVCADGSVVATVNRYVKRVDTEEVIDQLGSSVYTPQAGCSTRTYKVVIDTTATDSVGELVYKPGLYRYCPEAIYDLSVRTRNQGRVVVRQVRKFLPTEIFEVME